MRRDDGDNENKVFDIKRPSPHAGRGDSLIARFGPKRDGRSSIFAGKKKVEKSPNKAALAGIFLLVCAFVVLAVTFVRSVSSPKPSEPSVGEAEQDISPYGDIGGTLGALERAFGGIGQSFAGLGNLTGEISGLAEDVSFLQANIISLAIEKKGDVLISRLGSISDHLKNIQVEETNLDATAGALSSFVSSSVDSYLSFKLDLLKARKLVDSLRAWLASADPRHILVMLQNPSEIRPAGGFLGSYADVVIQNGNIESFDIRDITDPDKVLDVKTIPPKPLQALVKNWRAADANWFFDFSQSAATVIRAIESSALYTDKNILFDGAIAVSPKVIEDILKTVGPVTVGKNTFDSTNFFVEIQKIVQAGQASGATYPKGVLKDVGAAILEKVAALGESASSGFFAEASDWINGKDVMAYFKDPVLESFADEYGMSGKVYELPNNFIGDYVALVEANIGGGKSDLFVERTVALESQINSDGTVNNQVTVTLDHRGDESGYWWYKVPSQLYLQLFVPPSSRLINSSGGVEKKIVPQVDYKKNGYLENQLVLEIESSTEKVFSNPIVSTHKEDGKNVFSVWSKLKPGEKGSVVFSYAHRPFLPPADGQTYNFVFEKQAGIDRNYSFSISAPPGFIFAENNLPEFKFESNDPPGRLVLSLTLKKLINSSP